MVYIRKYILNSVAGAVSVHPNNGGLLLVISFWLFNRLIWLLPYYSELSNSAQAREDFEWDIEETETLLVVIRGTDFSRAWPRDAPDNYLHTLAPS